jgi:uncharacterized protein
LQVDAPKISLLSHAQTVTAALPLRHGLPRGVHGHFIELAVPEGGFLVAACSWQPRPAPAVILLHGVAGSSEDAYVVRAARALLRAGFHVLRLNQRGSGLGRGRARRLYHAGLGEDVAIAARFLSARGDVRRIGALGFSLGGHLALSHAADLGAGTAEGSLAAVATVSAPVDLDASMRSFEAGRGGMVGLYERLMVRSLVDKARALLERERGAVPFTLTELSRIKSIVGFDEVVTVRLNGFKDVGDYHTRVGMRERLGAVKLPTLMIHAADDPIVPAAPLLGAARSDAVEVVVTPGGGHVGFIEGLSHLWGATAAVARATVHLERHLKKA